MGKRIWTKINTTMRMRHYLQNTTLLIASSVTALALLEIGLRLFTPFPITETSNRIVHPRLGYTLSPALDDVDERGFRNTDYTLEDADLVVIGDSHTYGNNVAIKDNFPSILASKTARKVYNLGVGSYGIYQYKILMDELAQYEIKDVILALYPANDNVDELSDVVLGLDRTIREGRQFYKNRDGHHYRRGYEAYADAAVRAMERSRARTN